MHLCSHIHSLIKIVFKAALVVSKHHRAPLSFSHTSLLHFIGNSIKETIYRHNERARIRAGCRRETLRSIKKCIANVASGKQACLYRDGRTRGPFRCLLLPACYYCNMLGSTDKEQHVPCGPTGGGKNRFNPPSVYLCRSLSGCLARFGPFGHSAQNLPLFGLLESPPRVFCFPTILGWKRLRKADHSL